jgi:hypothetical protein
VSWIRPRGRRIARRLAAVDDYRFPAGVRHRFIVRHGELDTGGIALVEDATRQWFRLAARHPRAELVMPSVIAGDLWRETIRDPRDCASLVLPLQHPPRPAGLARTFHLAQEDEPGRPEALPLLFRVDRELNVPGGRHYLADCGGRGDCHELPGAICLRHVAGMDRGTRRPLPVWVDTGGDAGFGGGFGP